jgi:molecular chaperone DnaJ
VGERLEAVVPRPGLEKYGEAGEPFDPAVHEALMQAEPDPSATVATCAQVLQPGYRLRGGRVLRPARVSVAEAGAPAEQPADRPRPREGGRMSARDYVEKDYYAALGVPKDAPAADIKKAYRKLATTLHPDKNPGDAAAEARFKDVSEAYDVLSDDTKRREYDEARSLFGAGGMRGGFPAPAGQGVPFDLGDLLGRAGGAAGGGFGDVLGGLFGGAGRSAGRGPRRGADVEATVTLSFGDALRGATVPVRLTTTGPCTTCGGTGAAPGTAPTTCQTCHGQGVTTRNQGGFAFSEPCRTCRGKGRTVDVPCSTCGGVGAASSETTLNVRIPQGVADGQRVRLAGRGAPGERGGPAGDLLVTVNVTPHQVLGRREDDLTVVVP